MPQPESNEGVRIDPIFQPLEFRSGLKVKNRLFRSNISGRFDHYDGHGSEARLRWESSFAAGGVGCVISSFTPISIRGRIMVNYATIDSDDKTEFWSRVVDFNNALYPWRKRGNKLEDAIQICQWAVAAGADAIHVSSGSIFPPPPQPAWRLPDRRRHSRL